MKKPKSSRSLQMEWRRLADVSTFAQRHHTRTGDSYPIAWFQGAQQALAWALGDNAASASGCIKSILKNQKGGLR